MKALFSNSCKAKALRNFQVYINSESPQIFMPLPRCDNFVRPVKGLTLSIPLTVSGKKSLSLVLVY